MEASGFAAWHPLLQALVATLFTWFVTAVGAAGVFLAREPSRRVQEIMLGFAAGVMIAASYWSLLAPAIEMSEGGPVPAWIPATVGFLVGGGFLWLMDELLVIGAGVVLLMRALLPYALAFAAGAMIFVVVEELVPEGHRSGRGNVATIGALLGFTVMMVLDVALG